MRSSSLRPSQSYSRSNLAFQLYNNLVVIPSDVAASETYGISLDVVDSIQCYKGYLHYPNSDMFSGLLTLSPSIHCDSETLKQQKENRYSFEYSATIFSLLISVLLLVVFTVKNGKKLEIHEV